MCPKMYPKFQRDALVYDRIWIVAMANCILHHGTPQRSVLPTFGLGNDKHDYGRGFYLTEDIELAKEWAVCRPDAHNGWVHEFELDTDDLKILDFQELNGLSWLGS